MRRLILMRHARAETRAASGEDHDRALTPAGLEDARLMGRVLAAAGLVPDVALVSSAERTRQTWAGLAENFPGADARFDHRLYNAGSAAIRDAIERVEGAAQTVMLVGHNPGVPMAMLELIIEAAEPASVLDKAKASFPTASAVAFEFDEAMRPRFWNIWHARDHGGGGGE